MKTTIEIPEALYKRAKIRAVELGSTLKQVVLDALERALEERGPEERVPFAERQRLRPDYEAALRAGEFSGGTDSSRIVSEDRSSREGALL